MHAVQKKSPWEETYFTGTWEDELVEGETIESSAWLVGEGAGLTIIQLGAHQPQLSGALVTVWVQGGTAGVTYRVVNRIVTSLGRRLESSFTLRVLAA